MNKKSNVKRYLAALLTVIMIFQQSGVNAIFASSENIPAAATTEEEVAAQAEEAEEEPEEEEAEEPQEPTESPEPEQPEEPQDPEEPEEPEQPQETITPEATPETTPEVTETPEETTTPTPEVTEAPKKADFTADVDNATATVNLSEPISENAVFVAKQKAEEDAYFNNAFEAAESWLTAKGYESGNVIDAAVYDMHFEENGQEIAVNQDATVNLQFVCPILETTVEGAQTSVHVLHIVNGTAVETGSLTTNADGAVTGASIHTNGFSPFVFVKAIDGDVTQTEDDKETDLSKFFTGITVSVDGKEVTDDTRVKPDSEFYFSIAFAENSSTQKRMAQTVTFTMPNNLVNWAESGVLKEQGSNAVVASYTVDSNGKVTVTFTDEFMSRTTEGYLHGDFYFKSKIQRSEEQEQVTITIPGTDLQKTIKFNVNARLEANKTATYDPVSGEITYTVKVTAKEGKVTDTELTDILGESLEIVKTNGKDYSLKIGEQVTTGDFNNGKVTIGNLDADQSAELTYKAKFKDGVLGDFSQIDTNKTNNSVTATGKNGSKNVVSNTPTVNVGDWFKNYKWISKWGSKNENGKTRIDWTAKYNESKLISVKGKTVTDTIPDSETMISFKSGDIINVKRSDGKTFTITVPQDGKTWSYIIGSNSEDTYGNDKESYSYEFTYTTEVDSDKLSNVYGNVKVNNTISDGSHSSGSIGVDVSGKIAKPEKTCTGITADKASWQVVIHVPASGMKIWLSDLVQQVTGNNGDWGRYGQIDSSSINVIPPDISWYYVPSEEGRTTTGYFFFGNDTGTGKTLEENKTNSELPASTAPYDVVITYDTFNKYYEDANRENQKNMDLDAKVENRIKINGGEEIKADGLIPGKFNVEKTRTDHYTDQNGKYHPHYTNEDANQLFYIIKIDTSRSGLGNGSVTVVDSHSENLEYVKNTAAVLKSTKTYAVYGTDTGSDEKEWVSNAVKSVSQSGNNITFVLQNLGETQKASDGRPFVYYLYYRMKIKDDVTTSSDGVNLTNTATVTKDGNVSATTNTVEYNYKKPLLNKKENQYPSSSNGYNAEFEITVPSETKYITNGSLIVRDEYTNNLLVDNSSFMVMDQDNNFLNAGSDYSVTQDATGMQIEIKNAVAGNTYKIVYKAFVVGTPGVQINYTNKAYIPGHEEQYYEYKHNITKTQLSGGTVGIASYKFSIYKYGSDDQAVGLEGAEFTLYQDSDSRVLKESIKTGKDGKTEEITSSGLNNGYIMEPYIQYRLHETKAPSEYQPSSNDIYFYFTNDTLTKAEIDQKGLKGTALYTGQTLNIANNKIVTGSLTVSKTIEGNAAERDRYFKFEISVTPKLDGTYSGVTFVNGKAEIQLKGGESWKIEGLPNETRYKVEEKDADGYKVSKTGDEGTISSTTGCEAAFTNTKNTYGSLKVEKHVEGNGGDKTRGFEFRVNLSDKTINGKYGDMTFANGTANFTLKDGEIKTAENLPNGITYEVEEADYSADGYATAKSGDTGSIAGGSQQTASFRNSRNIGSLTVSKTIAGNAAEGDRSFKFEISVTPELNGSYSGVTFVNGKAEIQLKGGESRIIEGLPNGTAYKVEEKDADGYKVSKTGDVGTISSTAGCVAVFTNTKNAYGSLKVEKHVEGNGGDKTRDFEFCVNLSDKTINGKYGDMTFANGTANFTLKDGEIKTAENLPNGITYEVEEADYSADGYATAKSGDTGSIAGGSQQTASFRNSRNIGSLTVSKTIAGNAAEGDRSFKFEISVTPELNGSYSGVTFVNGKAEIQLKGGESRIIEGLPNGTAYKVEEKDADGYKVSKTGDEGTISSTAGCVAAFTNTKNAYGSLKVEKHVEGNGGDKTRGFEFRVNLSDKTINGKYGDMTFANGTANFTLKDGEIKTAENLPNGITYEVEETDYSADGYATAKSGDTGSIAGDSTQTASFINSRNVGSLTVSKSIAGNAAEGDRYFKFEISVTPELNGTYSGVTFKKGKAEIQLRGGDSRTIKGLPNGTEYKVEEKEADGYEVSKTGDKGTISSTTGCVAEFTNTKNAYGNLKVEKHVEGNGGDKTRGFEFRVNLSDKTINGKYGDMTFANGTANFTLKDGEIKTAENLPNGITYEVEEADYSADGYSTKVNGNIGNSVSGRVNADEISTVQFVNTKTHIEAVFSKTEVGSSQELSGAKLEILEEVSKAQVTNWQSDGTVHKVLLEVGKTYIYRETEAPKGYEKAEDIVFKVTDTGKVEIKQKDGTYVRASENTLHMEDKKIPDTTPETTLVAGTKIWSDNNDQDGKRPDSIVVNLLANGTKVDSKTVTEKDGWKYSFTNLPKYENGKIIEYTITEDAVADYSTEVKGYNLTNSYTPGKTSVTVTKAWVDNDNKSGKRPSEIKVQLHADGKESGSPVTLNEANKWTYTWSGLDEKRSGSTIVYTVKEVGTVDGYETSVSGDARTGYTITNTLKSGTLEIVKSITGAISDSTLTADQKAAMTFTVTGPDGYSQTVHYSDFTNGKYTFSNLPLGDYTVTETNADIEGYKLTTTYSVDGGKATVTSKETATVTITNDYTTTKKTSVKISKVDSSTYEVLGGAHLMVIDPDGKVVDEWDSTKKAHKITDLKPGVTYTLRETVAPKGYDVAADTTFELNEDGTFNTANTTTTISDDTLFVVDEKTVNKDINVSVTKRLVTVDGTVIGAPDATYYVALYSDPDCTQRVSDVKALNYKNASSSTVTFTGLKEGQTYYVGECETDGTSYLANVNADGTMYTVDFSNGNTVEVKNSDGSTTVYFDNQFEKIPDGFYKEGELNITKKLVGGDGKAKNSSEIFYAGIFSDEDFTQLSPDVSENIVPLDLAGGSEATSQVKVSIPESGSITLYVTEVDSKGNPVAGAASFKYDVSVDNAQVTFDDDNISADVIITNTEDTPEITPTPGTPNTPNTPSNGTSRKAGVKTGDSTPIGMFVGLFAAAAIIAGAAVFFKRRKK